MYSRLRLLIVYKFLLSFILCKSLIAQKNDSQNSVNVSNEKTDEYFLNNFSDHRYLDGVRKFYERVLENDSTNYDALTNLGVIYQQTGDMEKSFSYFEKAVKFDPQKSRAYHNLGILNSLMGGCLPTFTLRRKIMIMR